LTNNTLNVFLLIIAAVVIGYIIKIGLSYLGSLLGFFSNDIFSAAYRGNIDKIRNFIETGADIDAQNSNGYTILHIAVAKGNRELIQYLLEKKANANIMSFAKEGDGPIDPVIGNAPIHYAIFEDRNDILKMLLENDADADIENSNGSTPLFLAIKRYNLEAVKLLLDYNCSLEEGILFHTVSAQQAADEKRTLEELKQISFDIFNLLLEKGANPHYLNFDENLLTFTNILKVTEKLIDLGLNVNHVRKSNGCTPLKKHKEKIFKNKEDKAIIELLISKGAMESGAG